MSSPAPTLWFTGLSGAGKTTLSRAVATLLRERGMSVALLDGDDLRSGLSGDLGFNDADRDEAARRASEVALLLGPQGITTIASLIAPRAFSRNLARQRHVERGQAFFEIYVATPLSVCQARDPKALYRGSQQGEVKLMTGVDSSYEAPLAPELVVSTEFDSTETLAQRVVALL